MSYIVKDSCRERGKTMTQITRHEAENIILSKKVISSNVEQDRVEMRIFLTLSDDSAFLVKYNLQDHEKSYFFRVANT